MNVVIAKEHRDWFEAEFAGADSIVLGNDTTVDAEPNSRDIVTEKGP